MLLTRFLRKLFRRRGRLAELRRVVLAVPDAGFDMHQWSNECGTIHCAAGWAALDPWFLRHTELGCVLAPRSLSPADTTVLPTHIASVFGLAYVFGITSREAKALFIPPTKRPVSRREVVAQIDDLLAGLAIDRYPGEAPEAWYDFERRVSWRDSRPVEGSRADG